METKLQARLFSRTGQGYVLTESGNELFEVVARVEEDLIDADRVIFGKDQNICGILRFTCTEIFINGYLGEFIWTFLQQHPAIELQLICTQSTLSLSRGDADLAIRFTESPPESLIGRRLTSIAYGIYAASGPPSQRFRHMDRSEWEWIGLQSETYNRMLYGAFAPESRLKHRVDNMLAMHSMVRAGLGVAILPCYTADRDPTLVKFNLEPLIDSKFDMWILYHQDSRHAQRLRLFADFVIDHIKEDIDLFEGRRPNSESICK